VAGGLGDPAAFGVAEEGPRGPQFHGLPALLHVVECVECIDDAVPGPEEDEPATTDDRGRRGGPLAVEDAGADVRVVGGDEAARVPVEDDQTRSGGVGGVLVSPLHSVARADVEQVADHQRGAVGGVVGLDAEFGDHVVEPQDVGVVL